jgi:hypothetical protein
MPNKNGLLQNLKTTDWIYWIAINEIIGGIFGLALVIFFLAASISLYLSKITEQTFSSASIILVVIGVILYALSIAGGWLLRQGDPRGMPLSLFIQIMQLVRLSIPGIISYRFASGISLPLDIGFSSTGFYFNINLTFSSFSFNLSPTSEENIFFIGTNLIAIFSFKQLILKRKQDMLPIKDSTKEGDN